MTTGDPVVAGQVGRVLGGEPRRTGEGEGAGLEVRSCREEVAVVVRGREAVRLGVVLGAGAELFSSGGCWSGCGEKAGVSWGEWNAAARAGRGGRPRATVFFSLAEVPDLGLFEVVSSSWAFAESMAALKGLQDGVRGVLRLEQVCFATKSGIGVRYRRPVLERQAGLVHGGRGRSGLAV